MDKFSFIIENYGKCLTFPKNHLCAKARIVVFAKYATPPTGKSATSREKFYLNYDAHRLSLPNQFNTFIKNTETSINFSHPLINISPPIGTFSTDNCISQIQRAFSGSNSFSQDNIAIMENNQIIPIYMLNSQLLEKISDKNSSDITQSRLFLTELPNFPFSCLDPLTINVLNDNYRHLPPYGEQSSQQSYIPPFQRLDIDINIQRNINLMQLLFPSELPLSTLNKPELDAYPQSILKFSCKLNPTDQQETEFIIDDIKLYIDSLEILYQLCEPSNMLLNNIFTAYEFNQSALTRNSRQTFDIFINDESTNFLYLAFTTEREIKHIKNQHKDFVNTMRRLPENLEKISIEYECPERGEFVTYDNFVINDLHLDTINTSKINYVSYLCNQGFLDPKSASSFLYRQLQNRDKVLYENNVYTDGGANTNVFNVFPVSLNSLKKLNRERGKKYIGTSNAISRPSLKIHLTFTSSTDNISKYYLHVIEQQSKIITFPKDPFIDQSVAIENFSIFK